MSPAQPGPGRRPRDRRRGVGARHPRAEGVRPRQARADQLPRAGRGAARHRDREGAPRAASGCGSCRAGCRTSRSASSPESGSPRTASSASANWWRSSRRRPCSRGRSNRSASCSSMAFDTRTATDRYFDILDSENTIVDPEDPRRPRAAPAASSRSTACASATRIRPSASRDLLDGVDLVIEPGETMALVGLTGSRQDDDDRAHHASLRRHRRASITSTASTCATSAAKSCARTWPWRSRTPRCSRRRCGTTCCSAAPSWRRRARARRGGAVLAEALRDRPGGLRRTTCPTASTRGRRGGHEPLGRSAPATRARACRRREARGARARRSAVGARRRHRGARRGRAARGARLDHRADRRAPAVDGDARRPGGAARGRPGHRGRHATPSCSRRASTTGSSSRAWRTRSAEQRVAPTGRRRPTDRVERGGRMHERHRCRRARSATTTRRRESRARSALRSLRLLGSLLRPLRGRLVARPRCRRGPRPRQVAGPALIASASTSGLPALMRAGLDAARAGRRRLPRRGRGRRVADRRVHQARGAHQPGGAHRPAHAGVPAHPAAVSLEFHESYTSGRIISRQTSDLDAIRELLDEGLTGSCAACSTWCSPRSPVAARLASGPRAARRARPARAAHPLVPDAVAGAVPAVARGLGEAHRAVRRDHDRHPRRQGVPQGERNEERVRRAHRGLPRRERPGHRPVRHVRPRPRAHRQRHGRGRRCWSAGSA